MQLSRTQKEILQNQLNNEKGIIEELKKAYGDALEEIDDKIALLQTQIGNIEQSGKTGAVASSMMQSKIYQKQYQQTVRDQVAGILDKLNGTQFDSISEYLTKCYTDGYIATMYDLSAQGLPFIMPIDQKAVVQALSTNSKLSRSLYESLGENINDMKKKVVAEISRGIAGNLSYSEIARNISGRSNAGMNRSIRIARTEGQRIQNTASYEAQGKAKEKGANIVKQWCATLDSRTRDSHRELDGKIVEVDEEFTINGVSAMFPGDFGDPAEDCNCRCCILQRARWDLGQKELDSLKERAEFYGLDKTRDFADFRKKYLKFDADYNMQLKFPDDVYKINGLTESVKKVLDNALEKLKNEYEIKLNSIIVDKCDKGDIFVTGYHNGVMDMVVNSEADFNRIIRKIGLRYNDGYFAGKSLEDYIAHEMAHVMLYQDCVYDEVYRSKYNYIQSFYKYLKGISGYADELKSGNEALAEAFVRVRNNEKVPPMAKILVDAYFGRLKK